VLSLGGRIEADEAVGFEVTLEDRDAAPFLARCEAAGLKLEDLPAYVRDWIDTERCRKWVTEPRLEEADSIVVRRIE